VISERDLRDRGGQRCSREWTPGRVGGEGRTNPREGGRSNPTGRQATCSEGEPRPEGPHGTRAFARISDRRDAVGRPRRPARQRVRSRRERGSPTTRYDCARASTRRPHRLRIEPGPESQVNPTGVASRAQRRESMGPRGSPVAPRDFEGTSPGSTGLPKNVNPEKSEGAKSWV
jgi:hypothetical protein